MKTYKTQKEVEKDIVDGVLKINEDVTFECNIDIDASINAHNINAWDINAHNINAHNINASNINAWDINASKINANTINAWDINAYNINALDINAYNINAHKINANTINASNINANTIEYYAFCIAYETLKVKTIKGRRLNSFHKCLDNEIEYKKDTKTISIDGKDIEISEESFEEFKKQFNK